ncbi:hypothetical protein ABMC88_01935 [Sulfitobacter sp. HNIBRBA2951]|uniref:hypothetical protein n=1 Tax=Sulfitobacter aquimarinus TaxID=3158557 RepID=UPI0032DF6A7D
MDLLMMILAIIAFIIACIAGMLWDYYKPARFRSGYHTITKPKGGSAGASSTDGSADGGGGCD